MLEGSAQPESAPVWPGVAGTCAVHRRAGSSRVSALAWAQARRRAAALQLRHCVAWPRRSRDVQVFIQLLAHVTPSFKTCRVAALGKASGSCVSDM